MSNIRISQETKSKLESMRVHRRESYDDIIKEIISIVESNYNRIPNSVQGIPRYEAGIPIK